VVPTASFGIILGLATAPVTVSHLRAHGDVEPRRIRVRVLDLAAPKTPSPVLDAVACLYVDPRHQADRGSELAAVTNPTLSATTTCPNDAQLHD